jgi:hypothetical protein
MVARGTVKGGVVVFDSESGLREGDHVAVIALTRSPTSPEPHTRAVSSHSILDIPTVSLGGVLKPLSPDDDVLGEMLDERS